MRVELTIDQLVLVGFEPGERYRIADAIERELVARIGQADLLSFAWNHAAEPFLRAPDAYVPHSLAAPTSSEAVGRSVAGSFRDLLAAAPPAPHGAAAPRAVASVLR